MDDFEKSLNDLLVGTFNSILKYEETSIKNELNTLVTIAEAHMIDAVGKQEDKKISVSNLASLLNLAVPTVTVAAKKLENKGFIKKVPCDKDGRRTIIALTDAGKKIEEAHNIFHVRMVRDISRKFIESEKEQLLKAIAALMEFFKEKAEAFT